MNLFKCVLVFQFFFMALVTLIIVGGAFMALCAVGLTFTTAVCALVAGFWLWGVVGGVKQYIQYWRDA